MFRTIRHILEMIRFSHTLFALPFALLAAVMAWYMSHAQLRFHNIVADVDQEMRDATPALLLIGQDGTTSEFRLGANLQEPISAFSWWELVGILLCMVTARSFAMSVNRLTDRKLDSNNPRTAGRHLPAGILNVTQVSLFAAACAAIFVASTVLFLPNWLPLALSIPVLAILAGYSYAKRFTSLAHVWLGAALGLSPIAAWIAIRGEYVIKDVLDLLPAAVLGADVLTWVAGFDILYACQDYDSDRRAKLHSIPVKFGIAGALRIAAVCHLFTICFLALLPLVYPFGWIYWAGVAAVAVLLVYEHLLVRPDDLSRVNAAFFNVNAVISLGLFAVGTLDLLL
jgi:4-hydroxybenzoate polyprenyltransferase